MLTKENIEARDVSLSETEDVVKRCSKKVVKRLQLEVPQKGGYDCK